MYNPPPILKKNSPETLWVKSVQIALIKKGFLMQNADGVFDEATHNAVCAFQQKCKLTVDGVVGPRTMVALWGKIFQFIFIHTTDTFTTAKAKNIHDIHFKEWGAGPYHFMYEFEGKEFQFHPITDRCYGVLSFDNIDQYNLRSIHLSYVGGRMNAQAGIQWRSGNRIMVPFDKFGGVYNTNTMSIEQSKAMINRIKILLAEYPHLKIMGHNQCDSWLYAPENSQIREKLYTNMKLCPIFSTPDWLLDNGISPDNIAFIDPANVIRFIETYNWGGAAAPNRVFDRWTERLKKLGYELKK